MREGLEGSLQHGSLRRASTPLDPPLHQAQPSEPLPGPRPHLSKAPAPNIALRADVAPRYMSAKMENAGGQNTSGTVQDENSAAR